MNIPRMFAPSVQFHSVTVPYPQLVSYLTAAVLDWTREGQAVSTGFEESEDLYVIGFPMTDEDYLSWGCMLMEELHDLCSGTTAEAGNEFLCCYPGTVAPAKAMYPVLYISDDGGKTWQAKHQLSLRKSKPVI